MKKCNGCKRELEEFLFNRKDKVYARCNDCSINSSCKKNICEVCGIKAIFNYENFSWGICCSTHKSIGMIDIKNKNKKCKYDGCNRISVFNIEGEKNGIYCLQHKKEGMVDVKNKKCKYEGCNKIPCYNNEGETKGIFCLEHKENNMVNVKDKKCEYEGCNKIPNYNNYGESKGKFCVYHKENNMVNVKTKMCEFNDCKKQPIYNYKGEINGIYCLEHKEDNMVDVKNNKCKYEGCNKISCYNNEGEIKGIFCLEHKEDNMVNVKDKKCEYTNCKKRASFNYEKYKIGKYCVEHKKENMVNVRNKTCELNDCKTQKKYGYCCQSPSRCAQHKLPYMISKPKKICIGNNKEECKEYATYGKTEPIHCEEHSLKDEFCWLVNSCLNCKRKEQILDKNGLCYFVCSLEKIDIARKYHNKVKESTMIRYIKDNVNILNKVKELPCDKIVNNECNLYRPDLPYHCGSFILIIECDEEQHKKYNWESCSLNRSLQHAENKRMYEIMLSYEGLPCVFLRWNPDNFKVKGEICKKYNMNKRLEILKKWVEYCMKLDITKLESLVQYKKLFYDDYDEADIQFTNIYEEELL